MSFLPQIWTPPPVNLDSTRTGKDPILRGLEGALSAGALTNVVRKGRGFGGNHGMLLGALWIYRRVGYRNH